MVVASTLQSLIPVGLNRVLCHVIPYMEQTHKVSLQLSSRCRGFVCWYSVAFPDHTHLSSALSSLPPHYSQWSFDRFYLLHFHKVY